VLANITTALPDPFGSTSNSADSRLPFLVLHDIAPSVELDGFTQRSNGKYSSAPQWPLRSTYRMPAAKMAYRLISPRPDAETQSHARQKWAHPNMIYEVAVVLQGGNWPYKYEIVTAPVGATIGSYFDKDEKGLLNQYGNVSWQPTASSGSHTFEILVTDCDGTEFTATWSVTIDASKFIFIQDGYVGTKVGTITQPLEDW